MGHLKECESADRLSAGRNRIHRSFRQSGQADRISASGMEPDGISAKQSTFAEDFMLEHSNSSLFIAMMGSASRLGAPKEAAKINPVLWISCLKQCFGHGKTDERPEERAMKCLVCANLERTYLARLSEYVEARSSAGYRVSTRLAAQINVEMERARYELEEHQAVCISAALPPALLPSRETTAKLISIAA